MLIYATKLSIKKALLGVAILGTVVWAVNAVAPKNAVSTADGGLQAKLTSNEERVALLGSFGWQVNEEPEEEREVQIPKEFDQTYEQYNAIQKEQGLDLEPYKGKRATLYTYELTEYPTGAQGVTANLLIRRDKLIAADISAAEADGFVHGITQQPQ